MDREEYLRYEPFLAKRAWAATLDYLFYFGMLYIYVRLVGEPNDQGGYEAKGFMHILAVMSLWFIYFPVIEGIFGFTLFKGVFDLKVYAEDRKDFQFVVSLKRHLLDPIDFAFFGVVAIILVKVRDDHKRLGDIFARSRIANDKEPCEPNSSNSLTLGTQTAPFTEIDR